MTSVPLQQAGSHSIKRTFSYNLSTVGAFWPLGVSFFSQNEME